MARSLFTSYEIILIFIISLLFFMYLIRYFYNTNESFLTMDNIFASIPLEPINKLEIKEKIMNQLSPINNFFKTITLSNDKLFVEKGLKNHDFYTSVYDSLLFTNFITPYEFGNIINNTSPDQNSIILDIGSKTGKNVDMFSQLGLNIIGIDSSPSMILSAEKRYPQYNFMRKSISDAVHASKNSYTHITCLGFELYKYENKRQFFKNCYDLLNLNGYLIVEVVDLEFTYRNKEKQIGNYTYKMTTETQPSPDNNSIVLVKELFKNNKTKQTHTFKQILYIESIPIILYKAQTAGFIVQGKFNTLKNNQYIYILQKN